MSNTDTHTEWSTASQTYYSIYNTPFRIPLPPSPSNCGVCVPLKKYGTSLSFLRFLIFLSAHSHTWHNEIRRGYSSAVAKRHAMEGAVRCTLYCPMDFAEAVHSRGRVVLVTFQRDGFVGEPSIHPPSFSSSTPQVGRPLTSSLLGFGGKNSTQFGGSDNESRSYNNNQIIAIYWQPLAGGFGK